MPASPAKDAGPHLRAPGAWPSPLLYRIPGSTNITIFDLDLAFPDFDLRISWQNIFSHIIGGLHGSEPIGTILSVRQYWPLRCWPIFPLSSPSSAPAWAPPITSISSADVGKLLATSAKVVPLVTAKTSPSLNTAFRYLAVALAISFFTVSSSMESPGTMITCWIPNTLASCRSSPPKAP